ncbi:MAG: hypothetical protein V1853_03530 [bacterium]
MNSPYFQKITIILLGLIVALEAGLIIATYFGVFTLDSITPAKKSADTDTSVVISPRARVTEVENILAALNEHKEDKKVYPQTLQGLVPDYLAGPSDPSLGFSVYRYVPVGDPIDFYTLTYSLSEDYGELLKGAHIASPKGLTGGEFPLSGSDLDNDGVDDAVEIYIYRTDSQNADTDKDGFSDGVEIGSGHNPRGK